MLFAFCTSFITSTSSLEYIFRYISNVAFIPIFLPFKTLQSIDFTLISVIAFIPSWQFGTFIFSEKSKLVFKPLTESFTPSGIYIIYVSMFPSNLTFSSFISFLYTDTTPLVQIVFKISGLESGTIISPSTEIISFFSAISLFIFKFSFDVSIIFYLLIVFFINLYVFF